MTSKKKNTFESNAVQNRFTAYLITAIHRKKVDYWKKAEYVRAHELMVGTDEMLLLFLHLRFFHQHMC